MEMWLLEDHCTVLPFTISIVSGVLVFWKSSPAHVSADFYALFIAVSDQEVIQEEEN